MTTPKILRWLALPMLLLASVSFAQTAAELELGFRTDDVTGNDAMYRSMINERGGFILRSLSVTGGKSSLFDSYRIDASDLGVSPAGTLRFEAVRQGSYKFDLTYRTNEKFHAVPTYANPLFAQGALTQHTFDQTRSMLDFQLQLRPDAKIRPFFGYSWNRVDGPAETTYHVGQDEFLLTSDLRDTDQELRGGAAFDYGRVYGEATLGYRQYKGKETLTLGENAGAGNNFTPVLGRPISVNALTRTGSYDGSTPFANMFVTGAVTSRLNLIGSFIHTSASSDGDELENITGSLASFAISRFYNGLEETTTSNAENTMWTGEARAEYAITDSIDFSAGYRVEDRELNGSAITNALFLDSTTFNGSDPRDLEEELLTDSRMDRSDNVLIATVHARHVGPFSLRGSYSQRDQEVTLTPDPAEVVITGGNAGTFNRTVDTFEVGATWARSGFNVTGSWRNDSADAPIFRTDFIDRDRYRLRASYGRGMLHAGVMAEQTEQLNDNAEYGFDAKVRQYAADFDLAPVQAFRLRGSWSRYDSDSIIAIRRPENFATTNSLYLEDGTNLSGGFGVIYKQLTLDADAGRFENEGTSPFTMDRVRARLQWDFHAKTGLAAEWSRDKYTDDISSLQDFNAKRIGIFLRYRP